MPSPKPRVPRIKHPNRWVIALVLLAVAMVLSVPVIVVGGVYYLASNYISILNEATEIDSQPVQSAKENEAER